MKNLIGQSLGRYQIIEQLGEGGMATVYKAFDPQLERFVAIKVIRIEHLPQELILRALKRFEREAKALARLNHPNIVRVIDFGEHLGKPYLVMDLVPGGTLKQKLTDQPMHYEKAASLLLPIARALEYAHGQGILHRDVKPGNILIDDKGTPILSDFGVAKLLEVEETMDLTGSSLGVGTPAYMAPEQFQGKLLDARADVYALGVVFYELVTGRKPYTGNTPGEILWKQASEALPGPRQHNPGLPVRVEKVILKALAKKPDDRYQDVAHFAAALENIGQEKSVPVGSNDKKRHHPYPLKLIIGGMAGLLMLIVGIGFLLVQRGESPAKPAQASILPAASITVQNPLDIDVVQTSLPTKYPSPIATLTLEPVITPTLTFTATATAAQLLPGATTTREQDGMLMLYVPAGAFEMGSDEYIHDWNRYDHPLHTVTLDTYWIDQTEVTNAMYALCVQAGECTRPRHNSSYLRTNYYFNTEYADYPVVEVSWDQASIYCIWAGGRLPTEAEWEKAARGTDGRTYPWGEQSPNNNLLGLYGTVSDTSAVGSYPLGASPYGALDMLGNVSEWVADWYGESYYSNSPSSNPSGPAVGDYRVLRGGSWNNEYYIPTAVDRMYILYNLTGDTDHKIGFRCAMDANP